MGAHIDSDYQKTLRVSQDDEEFAVDETHNIVEAIFKYGDYGQTIDSYDTESGNADSNRLEPNESAEIPLYLLLHISESDPEEAIVVLEQSSNRGMKMRFQDALQNALPEGISNEMSTVKEEEIYQEIQNADRITKLLVETVESPDELGGEFTTAFSPSATSKRIEYRPTEDNSIRLNESELERWVEGSNNPFRDVDGSTYTEFKLTVERAGSKTTIDFFESSFDKSRILEGIEREGGHPVPSYIGDEARQYVNQELLPSSASTIPSDSLLR